jgi:hypothetical protein
MGKIFTALLLAGIFVGNVHSATLIIDDFNTSQGPVIDVASGGATVSATQSPSYLEPWTNRSISVNASGAGIVSGDPMAIATSGLFGINNDSLETSTVTLAWTHGVFAGFSGASSGALEVSFLNNNPSNLTPTNITFSFGSFTLGPIDVLPVPPGPAIVSVLLNAAQMSSITSSSVLSLTFNGGLGYDVVLDSVSLVSAVPEPAEWMMLLGGLALVGRVALRKS